MAVARFRYVMRTADEELLGKILESAAATLSEQDRVEWVEALAGRRLVLRTGAGDAAVLTRAVMSHVAERGDQAREALAGAHTEPLVEAVRRSDHISLANEGFLSSPEAAEAGIPDTNAGPRAAARARAQPPSFWSNAGGRR